MLVPVVAVAQLVESRIVIPVVVGSSPISHPNSFLHSQFSAFVAVAAGDGSPRAATCVPLHKSTEERLHG